MRGAKFSNSALLDALPCFVLLPKLPHQHSFWYASFRQFLRSFWVECTYISSWILSILKFCQTNSFASLPFTFHFAFSDSSVPKITQLKACVTLVCFTDLFTLSFRTSYKSLFPTTKHISQLLYIIVTKDKKVSWFYDWDSSHSKRPEELTYFLHF